MHLSLEAAWVVIGVAIGAAAFASYITQGFWSVLVVFVLSALAFFFATPYALQVFRQRGFLMVLAISLSPLLGFGIGVSTQALDEFGASLDRQTTRLEQNREAISYVISGKISVRKSFFGIEYDFTKYLIPNAPGKSFGNKASGSIFIVGDVGFLVQGDGSVLRFGSALESESPLKLVSVPSNIEQFLHKDIGLPNSLSVRGVTVGLDRIWISFTDQVSNRGDEPCFGTSVLSADVAKSSSLGKLEFSYFHRSEACSYGDANSPFQTGGGLLLVDDPLFAPNKSLLILATGGDINDPRAAQNPKSGFGALTALEIPSSMSGLESRTGSSVRHTLAMGLRNPQSITEFGNDLCVTEQGPDGGDELNCFTPDFGTVANFGWPLASYGQNYGGEVIPYAPTLPSHANFGFVEPVYFWPDSSVAPATIVKSPWQENSEVIVGTLGSSLEKGANALHFFRPVVYGSVARFELHDRIALGERVRSIAPNIKAKVLWVLDDAGALWKVSE